MNYDNERLLQNTFTGKPSESAALWSPGVGEQFTIAGKIPVNVRAKVDNTDEGDKMMCALLVDAADAPFATYAMGAMPETEIVRARDETKGPADAYSTVTWKQVEASRKIVTFGRMDLRNPEAGYDPASATERNEPIEPNTYYDYTIWLEPTYYTMQAGHRLELYIVPFCGFDGESELAGEDAILPSAETSDDAAMNLNQDYTITIQNDASSASVPTTEKPTEPESDASDDENKDEGDEDNAGGGSASGSNSASVDKSTPASTSQWTMSNTASRATTASSVPRTGDDSPAGAPLVLALASAVVAAVPRPLRRAATCVRLGTARAAVPRPFVGWAKEPGTVVWSCF